MPIICFGVNRASQEKLVPITRQNSDSIVPNKTVITLELAVVSPENGPFWELEAEQSQQVACEDAPSPKRDTSDVKEIKKSTDPLIVPHGGRTRIRVKIYHKPINPLRKLI